MTFNCPTYLKRLLKKILISIDTSKAAGMDQIPAKFLRDEADLLALPLRNINLLLKLSTFPEDCKIAKLRLIFKKVQGMIVKTTDLFHFCC